MEQNNSNNLEKSIGFTSAMLTVVGMLIGGGVFFKPQVIYQSTGGAPGMGLLCWIIAGLITLCGGLTVAELAASIPETGGMSIYLKEIYGEKFGFLAGWMQSFLYYPGMIAALCVVFADQFVIMTGMNSLKLPLTIGVILVITLIHSMGGKNSALIGNIATVSKIAILIIITVAGFVLGKSNAPIVQPFIGQGLNATFVGGQVLLSIFFAFDGWINVCAIAGEMKDPEKDLAKALVAGVSIVLSVYLIINIAYLWVIPASELAKLPAPGLAVATKLFGDMGGKIIGVGIMVSVFGTANALSFTGSRVFYALGKEDILPKSKSISKINKNGVPINSLLIMNLIAILYALSGQFNLLTDFAIFSMWIFIMMTFIAVFINRRRKDVSKFTFRTPLFPIVPLLAMAGGVFVLVVQLITNPLMSLGSVVVMLLGLPIYLVKRGSAKESSSDAAKVAQKAAETVVSTVSDKVNSNGKNILE